MKIIADMPDIAAYFKTVYFYRFVGDILSI